ncbi:MAG: FkbM family methyltransferase [Sphingopyxis sp.]|nr:FkbM family methyltransferase [Sphingopyxis sp.]
MTAMPNSPPAPSPLAAFLDYGVKKTLHKWLVRARYALSAGDDGDVVTSRYGIRMRANPADRTFQYCRHATYGHVLSDFLAGQDHPFVFVDIGANQGLYSLLAARNPNCAAAIAFEPVSRTFELLQDNIALNGVKQKVRPVRAAVSLHSGRATIAADARHSGTASLRSDGTADAAGEEISILGIAGVDALIEASLPLIVKIDVEGHEETVVEALAQSAHLPRIAAVFYEVDARWTDAARIEATLRAAGFTRFDRFGFGRHYDLLAQR